MTTQDEVVISGERNLLSVTDFSNDLGNLRKMPSICLNKRAQLMRLLDIPARPRACVSTSAAKAS
jgi:heat-inducible transcriptional repressor